MYFKKILALFVVLTLFGLLFYSPLKGQSTLQCAAAESATMNCDLFDDGHFEYIITELPEFPGCSLYFFIHYAKCKINGLLISISVYHISYAYVQENPDCDLIEDFTYDPINDEIIVENHQYILDEGFRMFTLLKFNALYNGLDPMDKEFYQCIVNEGNCEEPDPNPLNPVGLTFKYYSGACSAPCAEYVDIGQDNIVIKYPLDIQVIGPRINMKDNKNNDSNTELGVNTVSDKKSNIPEILSNGTGVYKFSKSCNEAACCKMSRHHCFCTLTQTVLVSEVRESSGPVVCDEHTPPPSGCLGFMVRDPLAPKGFRLVPPKCQLICE